MRKLAWMVLLGGIALLSIARATFADDRAQEILKQARAAIGGEDQLQKIQSLGIKGEYRRLFAGREMSGDREISIALPDKYLAEDAFNPGGMSTALIMSRGLNAGHAWNGSSGGGGN